MHQFPFRFIFSPTHAENAEKLFDIPLTDYNEFCQCKHEYEEMQVVSTNERGGAGGSELKVFFRPFITLGKNVQKAILLFNGTMRKNGPKLLG